ncbi:MAG: bifunctional riboflavin kinase/FAD synthetase [Pseudomonadota bacterium]
MIELIDQTEVAGALKGACVAIGNFDGLHLGHQALAGTAVEIARKAGSPSGLVTFEPHPKSVFQPEQPVFRLTPPRLKAALARSFGVDFCAAIPFNRDLASVEAEDFVERYLVRALGISHIVSGYDFHFGKGRRGSPALLQELGGRFGFGVTIVDQVTREDGTSPFSSSSVRAALHAGNIKQANAQLGYRWTVIGNVVKGDRRGHTIGFPTANIMLDPGMEPCHGIYAVRVRDLSGDRQKVLMGAAYFGWRPTFDTDRVFLEAFLLDFDGDLYGHELAVEFVDMIRPDQKFDDLDALVAQMKRDCDDIRQLLQEDARLDAGLPLLAAQMSGRLYQELR